MKITFIQPTGANIAQDIMASNNIPIEYLKKEVVFDELKTIHDFYYIEMGPGGYEKINIDLSRYQKKVSVFSIWITGCGSRVNDVAYRIHDQLRGQPDYIGYPDEEYGYLCPIGLKSEFADDFIDLSYSFDKMRYPAKPITIYA